MNLDAIDKVTKGKTNTKGISPFSELELKEVYPNPNQPRQTFNGIAELADEIGRDGLLQPIVVVKRDDGYMIVSGERRYKAHIHNGAKTIKAHIITADDNKAQELALIENIQREDLTDYEVARYITGLWASGIYPLKSDLAAAIGKQPSYISKVLKTVKLNPKIIEDIVATKSDIGLEVLQELARIKDPDIQQQLYDTKATREEIRKAIVAQQAGISPAKKTKKSVFECCVYKVNTDNPPKLYTQNGGLYIDLEAPPIDLEFSLMSERVKPFKARKITIRDNQLKFYMPNGEAYMDWLEGSLKVDEVKPFKAYKITIEEI